jgi:hypothetical protein
MADAKDRAEDVKNVDEINAGPMDRTQETAQINAAVDVFTRPGLLLQVDADEMWTTQQLEIMLRLFEAHPQPDHAAFAARTYFGPHRVTTHPYAYGNRWQYEWIRAWRFTPGQRFLSHEPPQFEGQKLVLGHAYTMAAGLVFDHMSYATQAQVEFKERYYGYTHAVSQWRSLQLQRGPRDLSQWLPWITQPCMSYELP